MVLAQGIDLIFGFTAFRTEKPEKVKCEGVQSQCAPKNQSPQFESGDLHGPFHIRKALPSALTGSARDFGCAMYEVKGFGRLSGLSPHQQRKMLSLKGSMCASCEL